MGDTSLPPPPPYSPPHRRDTGHSYRSAIIGINKPCDSDLINNSSDINRFMAPVVAQNPNGNGQAPNGDLNGSGQAVEGEGLLSPGTGRLTQSRVTFSDNSIDAVDLFNENMAPNQIEELEIEGEEKREGWDNKVQFLMGVISYAVGLGNVWRFPYLCQQNGGGAFLIPYVVMMFLEGMPLFLIEMGIGQRLRTGPVGLWNTIHPYLGGVGISSAVVSFFVGLYYNVIITWCLFYLFHSFQSPLPWATCPDKAENPKLWEECSNPNTSATAFFWYRNAIDTSGSISDLGGINWKMCACLVFAWLVVWACVMKGIKTSGKVMYVTATFPYFVTTIFLIRAVMLPGASSGVAYMITPDVSRLFDPRVWLDAATQIFYSMGLAFGGLIAYSSYNPIKNNVKKDVYILSVANLVTSMYTAIVIFSILGYKGHMSYEKCLENNIDHLVTQYPTYKNGTNTTMTTNQYRLMEELGFEWTEFPDFTPGYHCDFNKMISDAAEGTGLAFIVFTQVMVEFPVAPFWAIMFFLMLLMLGLGSMFGTLEGVITSIYDLKLFPWMKKPILTGILCGCSCLIGLIFVTRAGEYFVKLFDAFAGSYGLMSVAFFEIIGVIYVYGHERFSRDIEYMTGDRPGIYWQIMWRFVAPVIMFTLFMSSMVMTFMNSAEYFAYHIDDAKPHAEKYPTWCLFIAGLIVLATMLPVPLVFFIRYFRIWGAEGDIPVASRHLDSSTSTARILRSSYSVGSESMGEPQTESHKT